MLGHRGLSAPGGGRLSRSSSKDGVIGRFSPTGSVELEHQIVGLIVQNA